MYKAFTFNSMGEHFRLPFIKNELVILNINSPKPNKSQITEKK